MPIEKNITAEELPTGDKLVEVEENEGPLPDINIEFDEDGGVTIGLGEEEDSDVPFDSNLAEVMDPAVLQQISSDLITMYEADKSSRKEWEEQYGKGLKMLGFSFEERTKPFKGACGTQHPLMTEARKLARNCSKQSVCATS